MADSSKTKQSKNKLDLKQFKETPAVKKLSKSKSNEELNKEGTTKPECLSVTKQVTETRGRKTKYATDEERKEAKRKQQKEYRLRKKQELEELKRIAASK